MVGIKSEAKSPRLSVIIPIYNEVENVALLFEGLFPVLRGLDMDFEVIAVDDGSKDGTIRALYELAIRYAELKIVSFRRNFGQTAATMAGIDHSSGDIVVSMDADMQNDPKDIPALLAKLAEGYDVVSGWRKFRKDAPIRRNFVSRVANRIISRVSGVHLNDYGCTLKAYKRDVIKDVRLYGEMHRFIPIYASWHGARVTQIPVNHRARQFGHSKYGLERVGKVVLDLLVVKFLDRYFAKPIYVFGGFGLLLMAASAAALCAVFVLKFGYGVSMILTPLPLLSAMCAMMSVLSILLGLVAEILVRTYYESQQRMPYSVKETINFAPREEDKPAVIAHHNNAPSRIRAAR
jgi:glycosyltransferase involved in cell wall biosynthesis